MIDTGLKNRIVLITGGNNPYGIGAATAKAFALQGAAIMIHYFRTQGKDPKPVETGPDAAPVPGEAFYREQQTKSPDEVVDHIRQLGGRVEAWELDLADPSVIPELFDRTERTLGRVEVLVNNAALCEADTFLPATLLGPDSRAADGFPLSPITVEKHDKHFAVNSRAVALMMAEFTSRHIARGSTWGRIINVSTDGASGFSSEVSYGASKHALESYSRAAAKELGAFGITVNVVSLGPTQTGWISPEMEERISAATPLKRLGQPFDAADAIVFLASEQARWVTGQLLYVGGGWQMPL